MDYVFFCLIIFRFIKLILLANYYFAIHFLISGRSCTTIKVSFSSIWFSLEISFQEEEDEAKNLICYLKICTTLFGKEKQKMSSLRLTQPGCVLKINLSDFKVSRCIKQCLINSVYQCCFCKNKNYIRSKVSKLTLFKVRKVRNKKCA